MEFEKILVFRVGKGQQFEALLVDFFFPASQIKVAVAVQQGQIGILVDLFRVFFFYWLKYKSTILSSIFFHKDLIYPLVIN